MLDDDEVDDCEFSLAPSDEEIKAMYWLLTALDFIHVRGAKNADRAGIILSFIHRWTDHQVHMHRKIHELKDVLRTNGFVEVEIEKHKEEAEAEERRGVN